MSRVFIDSNIRNVSSLPIVAILGVAPLVGLGIRFDLALTFALITLVVVPLTVILLHVLRDLTDDTWLGSWCMLIAGFWVTLAEMALRLLNPAILDNIGLYLPVLAVSPLVMIQVQLVRKHEAFGELMRESGSLVLVFSLLLSGSAVVREFLGNGTITLIATAGDSLQLVIPGLSAFPLALLASAAGGMLLLGFILAFRNWLVLRSESNHADTPAESEKGDRV